ncbi:MULTISPECIES: FeoB-associated Cys-rich membrane protein [Staphylococcus]|uniref:FeoB-associated Cys-rich membrane protein n=1 Tax=Staphylococcus nepalensis TaxID=214473 RepID=A0A2T4SE61_9STAP|nr:MULTISPECIES: FeoB-associated Cys-rich membrane protein [Staphylococcus]MBO1206093.1 FeoB-associated Cys-rich membrane protein [Staphylococcus nepalensis]MBO1214768.1 FeoB-associated Cys-rich membrane protein [Staphylococcus nepalensis]MBO1216800.1 FeoB-associated Cys-rich membrane protein [Staphylococcus nepalensis]MBO1221928.1 FeoB-associated Cys-rich membrane protein [Staphylococcus nepalensis]MBO1227455.1 FeoB-associated Cys-rich membrane protein [Staphylococcus nepalensis]
MSVIINVVIFLAIFSYAGYTLCHFFKKSKDGKCSSCGSKNRCSTEKKIL